MAFDRYISYQITDAGTTISVDLGNPVDVIAMRPSANPITMLANIVVNFTGTPLNGVSFFTSWAAGFVLNGNTFTINGQSLTEHEALFAGSFEWLYIDGAWAKQFSTSLRTSQALDAKVLTSGTVVLTSLASGTSANTIVCNGSGIPTYVAISGDITQTNAGVTAIGAGKIVNNQINASAAIAVTKLAPLTASKLVASNASGFLTSTTTGLLVNADVNAAAAIAVSKLAALTASQVVTTTAGGVLTTAATLSPTLGGTGQDFSASTGVVTISGGTVACGARTEVMHLEVSYDTGRVGDFKIYMPFAGTVTGIYGYVTKTTVGATAGTIVAKDNAGTTMTNGTITNTAGGDARGTAYNISPTTNNTFIATDVLTFTTATATAGAVQLSITFTRTT